MIIGTLKFEELYAVIGGFDVMIWQGEFDVDHRGVVVGIRLPPTETETNRTWRMLPTLHPLYGPLTKAIAHHCEARISDLVEDHFASEADTIGDARYEQSR